MNYRGPTAPNKEQVLNESVEERIVRLESNCKRLADFCQKLVMNGEINLNLIMEGLDSALLTLKWEMDTTRILSNCASLDEGARKEFHAFAAEAATRYEVLEHKIAQLKGNFGGPGKSPGESKD
jgi:hypothetical protein